MRQIIIVFAVIMAAVAVLYVGAHLQQPRNETIPATSNQESETPVTKTLTDRRMSTSTPQTTEAEATGKLKADLFKGKLESVNTGCFADGECFVEVDGKHITTLRGWSQDTVGTVQGVAGFGDLETHIGEQVEVYAHVLADGTYTLYGSQGFYVKLLP